MDSSFYTDSNGNKIPIKNYSLQDLYIAKLWAEETANKIYNLPEGFDQKEEKYREAIFLRSRIQTFFNKEIKEFIDNNIK